MAMPMYSFNGKMWHPCPTTSDKNSFFHSAFGKRANDDEAFFDKQAKFRRMRWATFLTYFESSNVPPRLADALRKSWSAIEKYRNASVEDTSSFEDYVSDIMGAQHNVLVEEIVILATLENIEIVVLSADEANPIVIRPEVEILGDYPNNAKAKEAVVLLREGNTFSRLEPVSTEDLNQIINESATEISNELSSSLIKYDKGGSAGSKGVEYQVGILTVFLLNAFGRLKHWKLSTENKAAGKFDDVVLEWQDGAILLQAKHKQNKPKITLEDLKSTNTKNDDFSLPKYFLAYEEIKNKFKINNVIICTNATLDKKISEYVECNGVNTDSVLHYGNENCIFYTFNDNLLPCLKDSTKIYHTKNYQNKGIKETVITEENIKNFLKHLQFYSGYPPEGDMMEVAEDILSRMKQVKLLQGQISSSELYAKMMDWFQEKKGVYITETYAKAIFSEIRRDKHWQRLEDYNVLFKYNFDFQDSQRIYHITVEDRCLLQEIKIFRTLQNTRTNILYASLDDGIEGLKQAIEAFRLPMHTILVLVWSKTFGESVVSEVSNELKFILNKYSYKKVILVAESNNALPQSIGLSCNIIKDTVSFEDLLKDTQNELLQRNVIFQGKTISLQELCGEQSIQYYEKALNIDVLEHLVKGEEVKVGVQPTYLGDDINRFYIDRSFERAHQKTTDNESFGSNVYQECLPEESIYAVNEKLTLISDIAGMGKSTVLTKLAALVKANNPHLWVIRVELIDYTAVLKDSVRKNKDTITLTELLNSKSESQMKSELEKYVFSIPGKVVLMLDSIDEISPDYTRLMVKMLVQCQKEQNFAKIFVTTRPHVTQKLESYLRVKPFALQPFTKQNQIDFLTKYWTYYLCLNEGEIKKCKQYVETLITKMSSWIASTYSDNPFTAVPQQVRMLAEIFQEKNRLDKSVEWEGCKEYLQRLGVEPKLPDSMSLTTLYKMFMEKKREVFIDKGNPTGNTAANQALMDQFEECLAHHRNLALEIIVGETKCHLFSHYQSVNTNVETICKIGIVQKVNDEFHFVHRTFAEYFVAQSLVAELQLRNQDIEFQSYLIDEVLVDTKYNITRAFLNSFLEPVVDDLSSETFQNYQSVHREISSREWQKFDVMHQLAEEGCITILRLLFKCINFQIIKGKLIKVKQVYNFLLRENPGSIYSNVLKILQTLVQQGGVNINNEFDKTPLVCAIQNNRLEMVKFLVSQGADIHINRYSYGTPLHEAVSAGFFEISHFLVQQGTDIKARDGDDYRVSYIAIMHNHSRIAALFFDKMLDEGLDPDDGIVLYTAAYLGRLDIIKDLIGRGADINCKVERGESLIFAAARGGQLETVDYLISQGVDVNGKDDGGSTALHIISDMDSRIATSKLLLKLGANLHMRNSNGLSPLHISVSGGIFDLVKVYVDAGIPVDIKGAKQETPLYYAVSGGYLDIVKFLLDRGADVNSRDEDGRTALHGAVFCHNMDVVKYLVALGLDIMEADNFGRTLLHSAAYSGQLDVVSFLLELGVDINVRDGAGNTALYLAAMWAHFDTVEYLVEHGADVNVRNKNGATLQYLLASSDHWRMIRFLVKYGGKLDIPDDNGCTPLHFAVSRGYTDTVRYLLEQGVDINVRNKEGCTPLEMAPSEYREEMATLFETVVIR